MHLMRQLSNPAPEVRNLGGTLKVEKDELSQAGTDQIYPEAELSQKPC